MKEKATSIRDNILSEFVVVLVSIQLVGMPCYSCLVGHNFSIILFTYFSAISYSIENSF